jgi:hypothetical protein
MLSIDIDDLPNAATLSGSDRFFVNQGDESKRVNYNIIKDSIRGDLPERIDNAINEAKDYIDQSLTARNEWLPPVNTVSQLKTTGLDNKINYLCKVIADPVQSGVYQAVAGWEAVPVWGLYDDTVDLVNEQELESAVNSHNNSTASHNSIENNFNSHKANTGNPHEVTKAQIGLSDVDNVKQASKAEFIGHIEDNDNPHNVTKDQIGLNNVTNDAQVRRDEIGEPEGVAALDGEGKVPMAQLPSAFTGDYEEIYSELENRERRVVGKTQTFDRELSAWEQAKYRLLSLEYQIIEIALYQELCDFMYCGDSSNATAYFWYKCDEGGTRNTSGEYMRVEDSRGVFPRNAGINAVLKGANNTPYNGGEIGGVKLDAVGLSSGKFQVYGFENSMALIINTTSPFSLTQTNYNETNAAAGSVAVNPFRANTINFTVPRPSYETAGVSIAEIKYISY